MAITFHNDKGLVYELKNVIEIKGFLHLGILLYTGIILSEKTFEDWSDPNISLKKKTFWK